ncbi:MAG: MltA domain-containing protein [Burkholderiaceae bacterium]
MRRSAVAAALAVALAIGGCGAPAPEPSAASRTPPASAPRPATDERTESRPSADPRLAEAPIAPDSLPGWQADTQWRSLSEAIDRQCALKSPPVPWPSLCEDWRARRGDPRDWIRERFVAWPLRGADDRPLGLLTGYYEPLLRGSSTRESAAQVPLYRRPADLLRIDVTDQGQRFAAGPTPLRGRLDGDRVVPYPTRAEIESSQALQGQELLWLDDPVDAFFLQIQGSGRVRLRDGRTVRVGYAEHNGQPYRAIGRVLVERGAMRAGQVDAESIKAWLRRHPDAAGEVMRSNPRYIFFRELPPAPDGAGPPGSLGVPLTPMRSIATDPRRVPAGALMYVDSVVPGSGEPLQRLVLSQDTGAAIVGPVRADLFWGFGDEAERRASATREPLRLWLLWPRELGRPAPAGD